MKDYGSSTYGDHGSEFYDKWHASLDPTSAVATLAEFAGTGPALELGVGTGRVAIPLAQRGIEVHGLDASEAMLAKLREKHDGHLVRTLIGDLADVPIDGAYSVVFAVFNTFFAVLTQDDQVRCLQNVETRLAAGGVFVIEAFVPDPARFDRGQRLAVASVELESVRVEATRHDPIAQVVDGHTIELREHGARLLPVRLRYAWPSELDLMARLADLRLRCRWGGWEQEPFTAASASHVSVYERA